MENYKEMIPAEYWQTQASEWHERYKEALKYELDHAAFKEALERLASGKWTADRGRAIAQKVLNSRRVQ